MVTTVSGAIASFKSVSKKPISSLKVYFSPIQNGSGDPSPTNVREISGRTGLTVYETGDDVRNALNIENGYYDENGASKSSSSMRRTASYIQTTPGETNLICGTPVSGLARVRVHEYDSEYTWLRQVFVSEPVPEDTSFTYSWVSSSDAAYFRASWPRCTSEGAMELYTGIDLFSMNWSSEAGEVYGGYVDLISGELVVTHKKHRPDAYVFLSGSTYAIATFFAPAGAAYLLNSETDPNFRISNMVKNGGYSSAVDGSPSWTLWHDDAVSTTRPYAIVYATKNDFSTSEDLANYLLSNNFEFIYQLATPEVYNLSSAQIKTFINRNNIWSAEGYNVEASYDFEDLLSILQIRQKVLKACQIYKTILPPGYEEYDWVETSGHNAKIDTGVTGNDTTLQIETAFMPIDLVNSYSAVFGNYYTESDNYCWRIICLANTNANYKCSFYVTLGNRPPASSNTLTPCGTGIEVLNQKVEINVQRGSVIASSAMQTLTVTQTASTKTENTRNITIGASSTGHTGGTTKFHIYRFKMRSQGKLVRDFRPCKRLSDNKCGFYDMVNYTFNPSIGSVDFIAGNDIGGLYVYADNSRYYSYAYGTADENVTTDSDYFITGFYDTGSETSKNYTVPMLTHDGNVCMRMFNDKTAACIDYFNIARAEETRTFDASGRYIMVSVYKPRAADFYIYDNTNQRYVVKGSNVT